MNKKGLSGWTWFWIILLLVVILIIIVWAPTGNVIEPLDSDNDELNDTKEEERICICSYNAYNCKDFSKSEAQECFEYCGGILNDVHHLDRDKDGLACEWNN